MSVYRSVEVGEGVGDLGEGIGEPFEMFEKEDMSDMFRRAMFEKMNLVGRIYPSHITRRHTTGFFKSLFTLKVYCSFWKKCKQTKCCLDRVYSLGMNYFPS